MRLIVGITEKTPGWEIVLEQIGVPCQHVSSDKSIPEDEFVVLIIPDLERTQNIKHILEYLNDGGSILIEADAAKRLLSQKVRRIYLKTLYAEEGPIFSQSIGCDLFNWAQVAQTASHCKNQNGKNVIGILSYGKGNAVILPSGLIASLLSTDDKQKFFYSESGGRLPSEKVSKVSKGSIRHIIQNVLAHLYHCRGVPFVHLWHFPNGAKNVFSFRVDTDFGTQQEVGELYSLCQKNRIPATWFVETRTQAKWIRLFRDMKNQEIGYHCYRHRIFPDDRKNRENIIQGLNILRSEGIYPKGYAAPYGEWNSSLGKILQEQQFEYSSEFELDYDDLPFYPYFNNSFSTVLQVPIHPVSIGNLRRARQTKEQYILYYKSVIREKLDSDNPILIYHHPGHQNLDVFQEIFREIQMQKIPSMSMGEYSTWWKRRSRIDWTPAFYNNKLVCDIQNQDESVYLRAISPKKKSAVFPFKKVIEIDKLAWKDQNRSSPVRLAHISKWDSWRLWVYRMENIYGKLKS